MNDKYNLEIEQCILGAILTFNGLILKAIERKITSDMFYRNNHKEIYKAIIGLINNQLNIDKITLLQYNKNNIDNLGGITYVDGLTDTVPSIVNFEQWLDILKDYYEKRSLIDIANTIHAEIDKEDILNIVENKLLLLHENNLYLSPEEKLNEMLDFQDKLQTGKVSAIKTEIRCLDSNLGGFSKSDVITIISRSGIGKSTLAIQIALNMINTGYNVLYISNEMDFKQVMDKILANQCNIEFQKIRDGLMNDDEYLKYINTSSKIISKGNFNIEIESNINSLIAKVKLYKLKNKLDVVFIDYVNLMLDGAEGENMTNKLGDIMRKLKLLAMDQKIVVVTIAQVNRTTDKENKNKAIYEKIGTADIQDSARIEQFSNTVISIYRNLNLENKLAVTQLEQEGKINLNSKNADENPNCANITIIKSRFGKKTTGAVKWEGDYFRIKNFER